MKIILLENFISKVVKKLLLPFFFLLIFNSASADSRNDSMQHVIDSLEHELNICNTDSGKVELNNKIVVQYFAIGITTDVVPKIQKFNSRSA